MVARFFASLSEPVRAAVFALVAMLCFAIMGALVRLAAESLHSLAVVFFRNVFGLGLAAPLFLRGGLGALRTERFGLHLLRAAAGLVAVSGIFTAVTLIPLAEVTALTFAGPLFATLGALFALGEVIRLRRVAALAIGFLGVLVVLRPGFDAMSLGAGLALMSAVALGSVAVLVKMLTRTERPETMTVWMLILQAILSFPPALLVWGWPDLEAAFWLCCLAASGIGAHFFLAKASALAEVTQLQPIEFVRLPLSALFGYLLFGEAPDAWVWVGGAVIFVSTAYITHREAVQRRRTEPGPHREETMGP